MQSSSGVLGVIGCPILEDELIYAISQDPDISRLYVVICDDSRNFLRKLGLIQNCPPVEIIDMQGIAEVVKGQGLRLLIIMKSMALHEDPQRLRQEVLSTLSQISPYCNSVLLFYGLCGNAFRIHPSEDCREIKSVHILCDRQGRTVDDCIAAVLGGTDGYYNLLRKFPGVFYLTPAWAENWKEMITKMEITRGVEGQSLETLKWLFDLAGYRKALKLDTGLGDRAIFEEKVDEFVNTFGFEKLCSERELITLEVIDSSFSKAKADALGTKPK
ncbi:MAG: DUF1638 domain-containing protein [Methanomassiliicoccales archaeon]